MSQDTENMLEAFDFLERLVVGIGEVAKTTGVPARQIRYWEEKGIIKSMPSKGSKTRCYGYLNIKKVILIKELLDDGYTLDSAAEKVTLRMNKVNQIFKSLKTD